MDKNSVWPSPSCDAYSSNYTLYVCQHHHQRLELIPINHVIPSEDADMISGNIFGFLAQVEDV